MKIRERLREALERDVHSEEFKEFFKRFLGEYSVFPEDSGPEGFISFMHSKDEDMYERKDQILRALLSMYKRENNRYVTSLLYFILWPAIDSIYNSKKNHGYDNEELWAEIQSSFFYVLNEYPVSRRPHRIASNIKLDTLNRICRWQREECRQKKIAEELFEINQHRERRTLSNSVNPSAPVREEGTQDRTEGVNLLLSLAERGIISDEEHHLIMRTRIYKEKLRNYARNKGLSYEAVKKQRQRTERIIRKYLLRRDK